MSPRKGAVAAALALLGAALLAAAPAAAAPTELTVRIEGKDRTLFEGPILSDGHDVQATNDKRPRHCDGTNNGAHATPGPTPTAAAVDAIGLAGGSFGAKWFPGFDDYYVERWGPDAEDLNAGRFWGVLVNGVLLPVGGCQYADAPGDEVLWAYDAFGGRRLLRLAAAGDPSTAPAPPAPTASVEVEKPLELEVQSYTGSEGQAPSVKPAEGVTVAPVLTEPGTGFETVQAGSAAAVSTDAAGLAGVTFDAPGWHRLKAQGEAGFIRSNRLDVCVEPAGGGSCGPLPTDAQLRVPPRYQGGAEEAPPSNAFSIGRVVLHRNGTATIVVRVPGPGRVALSGPRVSPAKVQPSGAAAVRLAVRPRRPGRAVLRRRGRLRVGVQVAFTPTDGTTASHRRTLTLRYGRARLAARLSSAPDREAQATLERSVRFLQEAQNPDGGFGGTMGAPSDPDFSAWAAYALAAAGINPRDQARPGGTDVFAYLSTNTAELEQTTDFDRVALVALASGTSPRAFGAVDPVGAILARQLPDGSFPQRAGGTSGWVNATIWSILPLSALRTPAAEAAVQAAAQWLLAQQQAGGSWGQTTPTSTADADMTGAALQALAAAGLDDGTAKGRALEFLATMQGPDGGFREAPGGPTNSATTAWVVQGMWASGLDPRTWGTPGRADPLSFLAALQRPNGSIGWTATDDTNSLWMTAQVGPALAGMAYPLPAVPRAVAPPHRHSPHRERAASHRDSSAESGHGGTEETPGDGTISGGGGQGAPLFSGPAPQSGGSTPHGARVPKPEPQHGAAAASPTVEGVLVGHRDEDAAPGLFGADSGGSTAPGLALALAGAALLALLAGSRRERAGAGVS